MELISIVDNDELLYKKKSLVLNFPTCDMKCGKKRCCNAFMLEQEPQSFKISEVIDAYMSNEQTKAIVCSGLEPFDSWHDLQSFIMNIRYYTPDDIVIYTGYSEEELKDKIPWISVYENIIIKFNRHIAKQSPHYDELLGVNLSSSNQYAKCISY